MKGKFINIQFKWRKKGYTTEIKLPCPVRQQRAQRCQQQRETGAPSQLAVAIAFTPKRDCFQWPRRVVRGTGCKLWNGGVAGGSTAEALIYRFSDAFPIWIRG